MPLAASSRVVHAVCRVLAPLAAAACAAGCGGASDAADGISRQLVCGIAACKPSDALAASAIAPDYLVASSGGEVRVTAGFRTGGGFVDDVQLTTDGLAVSTDGSAPAGFVSDASGLAWTAVFPAPSPSRSYRITFMRSDGRSLASTATLPAAFTLLSPAAALSLDRRSAPVPITVSVPADEALAVRYAGSCDIGAVTGTLSLPAPVAAGSGSTYTLEPLALYSALVPTPTTATGRCTLTLTLAREQAGTVDPGFRADGRIAGRFERSIAVTFDTAA